jgi:hypothetical protein
VADVLDAVIDVDLARGRSTVLVECEGCGARTSALLVLRARGELLLEMPVCDRCQRQLAETGHAVASEQQERFEAERRAGRSERLARRIARRWYAR